MVRTLQLESLALLNGRLKVSLVRRIFIVAAYLVFAGWLTGSHNLFASQPNLDSLRDIVALNLKDESHKGALSAIAFHAQYTNMQEAVNLYRQLYELASEKDHKRFKMIAGIQLANLFQELSQPDSSKKYLEIASANKVYMLHNFTALYNYYNVKGLMFKSQGNLQDALEAHLVIENELKDSLTIDNRAGNLFNISAVYSEMFDTENQIKYLFRAIELFETTANNRGLAFAYNALGIVYYRQNNYALAKENFLKSLSFRDRKTDKRGIAAVMGNIGNVLNDIGQHQEAIAYFNQSIAIFDTIGLKRGVMDQSINLGRAYSALNKFEDAIIQFDKSIELAKDLSVPGSAAFALAEKGHCLIEMGQIDLALSTFQEANSILQKTSDLQVVTKVQRGLRDIYLGKGMYKEAYEANVLFQAAKDSVVNADLKLQLEQLETRLEIQRKQAEIELLQIDSALKESQIARQRGQFSIIVISFLSVLLIAFLLFNRFRLLQRNKRLLEIERMRVGIAQDLHDDIGSALSSINILSQMSAKKPPEEAGSALSRIHKYTSGVMDRMGDIVWSIQPGNDSFEKLLIKMREFAGEILDPLDIEYEFHGDEHLNGQKTNLELKKNVFLIYKEALNNIAKYSHADKVNIALALNNNHFQMKISDNGTGFEMSNGLSGNGLKNMLARAKSIGGELQIDTEKGKGCNIRLDVKIT